MRMQRHIAMAMLILAVGTVPSLTARVTYANGIKLKPGFLKGITLPTVNALFTTPKLGKLTPGGKVYIKGKHFGPSGGKAKVVVHFKYPKKHQVRLRVRHWTATKITAQLPWNISGVRDQTAVLQVIASTGIGGLARKVPFYATRRSKVLKASDPAVRVLHCSTGGDYNRCNGLDTSTGGRCFATTQKIFKDRGTIYARHVNCDAIIDWDAGKDRYAIALKNGWVFKKVQYYQKKTSGSEKLITPDYAKLRKNLPGQTSWKPSIRWEVSPGPDQLEYAYEVTIVGPRGVPHY